MARNMEIKARLRNRGHVEAELQRLGAQDAGTETQWDVFYRSGTGRLKLRDSSRGGATLIHYERPDSASVRRSTYALAIVADPETMRGVLDAALGRAGEVRKERHLWRLDNVRVHLDRVEGLGAFLELEAVVDAEHPEPECLRRVEELLAAFAIPSSDRTDVAYVDLAVGGAAALTGRVLPSTMPE